MSSEVTWSVSPQVFSDLYTIISKHGMDPHIDPELEMALRGRYVHAVLMRRRLRFVRSIICITFLSGHR
jgi:hypothetical protein